VSTIVCEGGTQSVEKKRNDLVRAGSTYCAFRVPAAAASASSFTPMVEGEANSLAVAPDGQEPGVWGMPRDGVRTA